MKRLSCLLIFLCAALTLNAAEPIKITGIDGKEYAPLVPGDSKASVLFFVSPYCPTSNTFIPEINKIEAAYHDKFAFYLIHSDPDVKLADVLQHTEMSTIKTAVLVDQQQRLAKLLGASITPEVVVIGLDGKPLYQGRINDLYLGPTKRQRQATTKDLRDALDAIQAGTAVVNAKTDAIGCKIGGMK